MLRGGERHQYRHERHRRPRAVHYRPGPHPLPPRPDIHPGRVDRMDYPWRGFQGADGFAEVPVLRIAMVRVQHRAVPQVTCSTHGPLFLNLSK